MRKSVLTEVAAMKIVLETVRTKVVLTQIPLLGVVICVVVRLHLVLMETLLALIQVVFL
jgi:hypothetical protein